MKVRYILILLLTIFGVFHLSSQDRKQLERKRKSLNSQIKKTSKLLKKTSSTRRATLEELKALQQQINSRKELINIIHQEIEEIDEKAEEKKVVIAALERDLEQLEANYHQLLVGVYKAHITQSPSQLASLFLGNDLNKSAQQWSYLKQLHNQRHKQVSYIQAIQQLLNDKVKVLDEEKLSKAKLLAEENQQQDALSESIAKKDKIVKNLKAKETQLRRQIAQKEKSKRNLNKKIESVIRSEIAAVKRASRNYSSVQKNQSNQKNIKLSKDFAKNKGKLPMPVYKGKVVGRYGRQAHPVFEQVITENNGIDIKTPANASVKAVHGGEVVSVFTIPGYNKAVMLKHGEYYTTYSNLGRVSVKRGQKVKVKQKLGVVSKDSKTGNYVLHFELWKGKNKENPSHWLR